MIELACVLMASGHARRFGENKLLAPFEGKTLLERALGCYSADRFSPRLAVTRGEAAAALSACAGFEVVRNDGTDDSVAHTVALGIRALPAQTAGCLFAVCDQPLLTAQTVERLRDTFLLDSSRIVSLSWQGRRGNPVIFPRALFGELAALSPGETGRSVLARHPALLVCVEADAENELTDVDFREELARLRR